MVESKEYTASSNQSVSSIAEELRKLAKLKEEGIITVEEFQQIKQDLIRNNKNR
jgi:K+/H+ antiporter YhaU regulatory subunit KhtT